MPAFLPLPTLFVPLPPLPSYHARRSPQHARRGVRASAASSPRAPPTADDAASLLPAWAVQPAVPPGRAVAHGSAQWANFKQHLAHWTGDWCSYDATLALGGGPIKFVHSKRHLRVDAGTPDGRGGVETVTHTNTLAEQQPVARAATTQHMRYSDTKPLPTWIQPVRRDGSLGPPLAGAVAFQPATGGAWNNGTLARGLFHERLVLHPHVRGVRFSVGARVAGDGVRTLFFVREEDVAERADFLASDKGVFSRAMDVAPLLSSAVAAGGEGGPGAGFVVVEHALSKDLALEASVFKADGPPELPVGEGRVALSLPDGIDLSLPAASGPGALGRANAVHIRWKMDRGTWLHARSNFDEKGEFVGDATAVYYPV